MKTVTQKLKTIAQKTGFPFAFSYNAWDEETQTEGIEAWSIKKDEIQETIDSSIELYVIKKNEEIQMFDNNDKGFIWLENSKFFTADDIYFEF